MARAGVQTRLLIVLAFVSFGYATLITFLNVQRIRSMPGEKRVALESLDELACSAAIIESIAAGSPSQSNSDEPLQRSDIRVLYGDRAFAVSENVWVNVSLAKNDSSCYLHRYRVGRLSFEGQVNSNGKGLVARRLARFLWNH